MAIDSVNQLSNEQLLAMSMMGNGQLTNDSDSSDASNEASSAFQLAMQSLMDSSKKTKQSDKTSAINSEASIDGKDSEIDKKTAKVDSKNTKTVNTDTSTNNDSSSVSRTAQEYATGEKLQDIPITYNNNYIQYVEKPTSSASNRSSSADMQKIYNAVDSAAKKYGVDSNLILSVIKQESDFDSNSTSGVGAAGLMQIMPENFSSLGITNQYDVNQNVDGGTKLLKEYLDQYNGNTEMALMAYNGGPGTMQRRGVSSSDDLYKMPSETQNYVPKVMGYYRNGI